MLGLLRRRTRNGRQKNSRITEKTIPASADLPVVEPGPALLPEALQIINFALHMSNHIGETVTIYTVGGGLSGMGFTGVLLSVCEEYVRLLSKVGPAPACPSVGMCPSCKVPSRRFSQSLCGFSSPCVQKAIYSMGAITCIPVGKIVAFVHSSIRTGFK